MTAKSQFEGGGKALTLFISLYLYLSRQVRDFRLFKSLTREEESVKDLVSQAAMTSLWPSSN